MAELKALCMKCRENNKPTMQTMKDVEVVERKRKDGGTAYSAKGKCSKCGGNQYKFISKETADTLK